MEWVGCRQRTDIGHRLPYVKMRIGCIDDRPGVGGDEQQTIAEVFGQCIEQAVGAAFDGADFAQGRVHRYHIIMADAKGFQQFEYIVLCQHRELLMFVIDVPFVPKRRNSSCVDKIRNAWYNERNDDKR